MLNTSFGNYIDYTTLKSFDVSVMEDDFVASICNTTMKYKANLILRRINEIDRYCVLKDVNNNNIFVNQIVDLSNESLSCMPENYIVLDENDNVLCTDIKDGD